MTVLEAMTRFDGRVDAATFWICQAILIGATMALVFVLTRGRAYRAGYGACAQEDEEYFWVLVLTNAVVAYPTLAVITNRLNAIGWSAEWAWAVVGIVVMHALTQKLGLNGTLQRPTALGYIISIVYILGLIALGM